MKTITIKTYEFNELSEKAQEKAISILYNINIDHDWWNFIYEDAKNIGLKITEFDDHSCSGEFFDSAEETAYIIEKEHGENTETYKTAKEYLSKRDEIVDSAPKYENGEFENVYELDKALDEIDKDFLTSLLEEYRIILRKELEFLSSKEAIIETINANEYNFTEKGELI